MIKTSNKSTAEKDDFTTVRIRRKTHRLLCEIGQKGQNMDDIIVALIRKPISAPAHDLDTVSKQASDQLLDRLKQGTVV